jgi:hypothetical protein
MIYYECYYIIQSKKFNIDVNYHIEIWNNGFNYFVHISMTTPKPNGILGFKC